jgi:hypothetical protein
MKITPELIEQHQLTPAEYERSSIPARPRAELHRTGHLQRDVERALLLQELAHSSEEAADKGKYVLQGPGENAGIIDIGGGWVIAFKIESHNHPSSSSRFRARPPASAAFCATFSPWARGPSR